MAAGLLLDLVRSARAGLVEEVAAGLLSNPPLFASVFQNLDLLFGVRGTAADTLSAGVLEAVQRAGNKDVK